MARQASNGWIRLYNEKVYVEYDTILYGISLNEKGEAVKTYPHKKTGWGTWKNVSGLYSPEGYRYGYRNGYMRMMPNNEPNA